MAKNNYKWNHIIDKEIIEASKNARCMVHASEILGIPYTTFKRRAINLNVWNTNQGGKGYSRPGNERNKSSFIKEVLKLNGLKWKSNHIKRTLIKFEIKKNMCEICGQDTIWQGKSLTLHLDHKDGNKQNNELDNLRILCPNCHTQTETYGFKKRK